MKWNIYEEKKQIDGGSRQKDAGKSMEAQTESTPSEGEGTVSKDEMTGTEAKSESDSAQGKTESSETTSGDSDSEKAVDMTPSVATKTETNRIHFVHRAIEMSNVSSNEKFLDLDSVCREELDGFRRLEFGLPDSQSWLCTCWLFFDSQANCKSALTKLTADSNLLKLSHSTPEIVANRFLLSRRNPAKRVSVGQVIFSFLFFSLLVLLVVLIIAVLLLLFLLFLLVLFVLFVSSVTYQS